MRQLWARNGIKSRVADARVLALPSKRCVQGTPRYLEPPQMRQLLAQPDQRSTHGLRDFALLLFLYNTGARVSEGVAVGRSDLQLTPPYQVRLFGKGRKQRFCPVCPATIHAIKPLLGEGGHDNTGAVFRSARGAPLTRHGVQYLLRKYARYASRVAAQDPNGAQLARLLVGPPTESFWRKVS